MLTQRAANSLRNHFDNHVNYNEKGGIFMKNINTKEYWDNRFSSDWEKKGGRAQTLELAKGYIKHLDIAKDFNGTILDFGCALGDSIPELYRAYPNCKLIGIDISSKAIEKAKSTYGHLATFMVGTQECAPNVDIIIASNILEHLDNDKDIVKCLLTKCSHLYVAVPYKEYLPKGIEQEHVNSYNERYYDSLGINHSYKIFNTKGWGLTGLKLWIDLYLKNLIRPLLGKRIRYRSRQILFHFIGTVPYQDN